MVSGIQDSIVVRTIEDIDIHFLLNSTLECLIKYKESTLKGMAHQDAYEYLQKIIHYALIRCEYSVFIACHKEDSQFIYAFIISDPIENHVFFQYTKYTFRKLGIQKYFLLPLAIDPSRESTVNWPTRAALQMVKDGKTKVRNKFFERLLV